MTTFIMIARVLYDKGYSQYVEVADRIHKERDDVKFILAGDIDEAYPNHVPKEVIENDVRKNKIDYIGYHSDIYDIIKQTDCVVLPSYYNEGLSRVLMEGLAMSKPIITTDIPGCKETVEDGINGYLCKPNDVDSLYIAIKKFLNLSPDEKMRLGFAGRKKAEEVFDIKKVIMIYHSITDKI